MFLLNTENELSLVSESLASWFDTEPAALKGVNITALVRDGDLPRLRSALTTTRQGSGEVKQRFTCRLAVDSDSPPVEIELSSVANPSQQGDILGSCHGTADHRAGEKEPVDTEWFNHFFQCMDQAVVEFEFRDTEPIVRAVNPAFEKKFGYHASYVTGEPLTEYIFPDNHTNEATTIATEIANGNVVKGVYTRQTASGPREFYCRSLPIKTDDSGQYGLAIYTDLTEDQQLRQHLQVLHRVLRHNLRNELTVVFGMADEIANHTESGKIKQAADRITDRADKLVGVSSKAQMAQNLLNQPQTDTVADVGQAATEVTAEAKDKWPQATITSDIETSLPVSTGAEIREALENLIDNSITHNTGDPVVNVRVRKYTPIHVSTRSSGQQAVITIEDNGPGIPENERAVVFDEKDITQLKHGSGFGLWVVRWIAESANGTVRYDRTDGWTTIELRLPIVTDQEPKKAKIA